MLVDLEVKSLGSSRSAAGVFAAIRLAVLLDVSLVSRRQLDGKKRLDESSGRVNQQKGRLSPQNGVDRECFPIGKMPLEISKL